MNKVPSLHIVCWGKTLKHLKLQRALLLFTMMAILSMGTVAADTAVVNSRDWVDVYSVLLSEAQDGNRAFFLNSDITTSLTKIMAKTDIVQVYEPDDSFTNNLHRQLSSVGYDARDFSTSDSLNLDLDPQLGRYYVISRDNPRISISLAPLAVKEQAWVLVVDEDNIDAVVTRLESANDVIAVGNFRRDLLQELEPVITEEIRNNDVFADSQELATRFGIDRNVVLADGSFLETEFFVANNPVLLSGYNRILDQTYDYLIDEEVQSVVIVGNELSVIGEQIRERSDKEISVFVKFGQSDTVNSGRVYALTMFPLPKPRLALTVTSAKYDPENRQVIATFENLGNAGIYKLTSINVVDEEGETIADASSDEVVYIAAGEVLPLIYNVTIPPGALESSTVEFFTSFGLYPAELDTFLTMQNQFGPPFSVPLTLADFEADPSKISIVDVAYYTNLKRVGVTIQNEGENLVYYNVKINGLIVNGLEQDFFKQDSIRAGEEKTTYISATLDDIDLEENQEFSVALNYGQDEDLLLNNVNVKYPFQTTSTGIFAGLATGLGGTGSIVVLVIVILVVVGIVFYFLKPKGPQPVRRTGSRRAPPRKSPARRVPSRKKSTRKKTTRKKSTRKKSARRKR